MPDIARHLRPAVRFVVLFLLLTVAASTTLAQTPVMLLGSDLQPRRAHVQSLAQGQLTYFDQDRTLQSRPISEFVRLMPTQSADIQKPAADDASWLLLNDGQKLRGQLIRATSRDEQSWLTWGPGPGGQKVEVSLEQVTAIAPTEAGLTAPAAANDQLILSNGDRVAGFIEEVTSDGWTIRLDGQEQPLVLPLDRIRTAQLANPVSSRPARTYMLWLVDGSRLLASDVQLQDQQVTAVLELGSGRQLRVPIQQVRRIDLPLASGQLIDLPDLAWQVRELGEVFTVKMPPRVEGSALWLHAPVTVAFPLPPGANRFWALAQLEPGPAQEAGWADLELLVYADQQLLGQWRLDSKQKEIEINLPISGLELRVQLKSAGNGPVLDRLLLRDAVILVQR